VLALGKHGAGELNYSSDIDIVVFFDPDAAEAAGVAEPTSFFVKLTQLIARIIQERTPDGYVFRVDLRLRPDPASTHVAVSLPSAYSYYETVGQNWERAAMIKARPVAGDIAVGQRFIKDSRALHLAQIFRLRRDRRHPRDEAPDPDREGP
jgi:glutamate-ammonia-ligase adenylyltransferase